MNSIWKNKGSRIWLIVSACIVAFFLLVNIVASTMFYDLIGVFLGRERPILAEGNENAVIYEKDYQTKAEAAAAGNELNIKMMEEAMTLLKNENGALPLKQSAKISVFGKNSVNFVYGGSGSGKIDASKAKTLYESLEAAGFDCNPALKSFYENDSVSGAKRADNPSMNSSGVAGFSTSETPVESYTSDVKASYANYSDAALIVISRIGGEGFDLPRSMVKSFGSDEKVDGARNPDDHYLQLDANETALIQEVCSQNFEHVIVLINSCSAMELGFLDDPEHYAYHEKIDGCIWTGYPGAQGIMALGGILNGTVNPSGHLTDTYARNWKDSPVWANFGNNGTETGDKYNGVSYYFVDYEEGIYYGYRYYETVYADILSGSYTPKGYESVSDPKERADAWYRDQVVYPFGYGQSYSEFEVSLKNKNDLNGFAITKEGVIKAEVNVRNLDTERAGKQVVQLYARAPYTAGQIEKADKVLVGFAKTPLIEAGKSETVTIEFTTYDFASYDYSDANGNGFKGYEVEGGTYEFFLSTDAHTAIDSFTGVAEETIRYEKDPVTQTTVTNRYEDSDDQLGSLLSRNDWEGTWPATRTEEEKEPSDEFIAQLESTDSRRTLSPSAEANINSRKSKFSLLKDEYFMPEDQIGSLMLNDLVGADYDDPNWDQILDRITFQEMADMFSKAGFQTLGIPSVGKNLTYDSDGPAGWVNFMGGDTTKKFENNCAYATENTIGATWNIELLNEWGLMVGNEALVGYENVPYTLWYAPAVNIHRNPFGGRAWEYFSEDGLLSGKLAAAQIRGLRAKGVIPMLKHFAVNDQETHRSANGLVTWLTEQSLREIYLKPFEIAVKEGGTTGIMSSFNRIGTVWAGGDYRLLTQILRNEWGFRGAVICDYNDGTPYMNHRQMAYAGGDLNLATRTQYYWNNADSKNPDDVAALRQTTKNTLYAVANSNSCSVEILGVKPPIWFICMFVVDGIAALALAVWGYFAVKKALKKEE